MADAAGLWAHLKTGATTVCRCWAVTRRDGHCFGFTDHDGDLEFEGIRFKAETGLTARALQQTTGLSVDNTEAQGALSAEAITEADLMAGLFDGAAVQLWSVNWQAPDQRVVEFSGSFGEVARSGAVFRTELRGLAEALNQPRGRVFQRACPAELGDGACRFDLTTPGYTADAVVEAISDGWQMQLRLSEGFEAGWFRQGRLTVLTGVAAGFSELIRRDDSSSLRDIALWQRLGRSPAAGDVVRLFPGCDKRTETCKLKFNNFLNYRGHPHIPGESWLASYPTHGAARRGAEQE